MNKKTKTALTAAGAALLCAAVILPLHISYTVKEFAKSDRIAPDAVINTVPVGGLTKGEAEEALKKYCTELSSRSFTVVIGDSAFNKPYYELGYFCSWKPALEKAYSLGRTGGALKKYLALKSGKIGKSFAIEEKTDRSVIDRYIAKINRDIDVKPKNASLVFTGSGVRIIPGVTGKKIDEKTASELLYNGVREKTGSVNLEYVADHPAIKTEDLQCIDTRLGSFTTNYNAGKVARTHNLRTASNSINGTIVMPGESFSYNRVVGPRDLSHGYKNAIIFQDGEEVEGMGGGVCQVSSTLFNAVLLSGLRITQRRCHSLKVVYVPMGRDAMVSYGSSDFCFVNDSPDPVVIFASVGGGSLSMQLWGSARSKKDVRVSSSVYNGGFGASVSRTVTVNGKGVVDYSATSSYRHPKPKKPETPPAPKEKPAKKEPAPPASGDGNNDLALVDG
ncbi:MAG: VanW family protein [Abditibacteriota bacterium]|nr:VanW family protein [Abditibacteriota bacterium]